MIYCLPLTAPLPTHCSLVTIGIQHWLPNIVALVVAWLLYYGRQLLGASKPSLASRIYSTLPTRLAPPSHPPSTMYFTGGIIVVDDTFSAGWYGVSRAVRDYYHLLDRKHERLRPVSDTQATERWE